MAQLCTVAGVALDTEEDDEEDDLLVEVADLILDVVFTDPRNWDGFCIHVLTSHVLRFLVRHLWPVEYDAGTSIHFDDRHWTLKVCQAWEMRHHAQSDFEYLDRQLRKKFAAAAAAPSRNVPLQVSEDDSPALKQHRSESHDDATSEASVFVLDLDSSTEIGSELGELLERSASSALLPGLETPADALRQEEKLRPISLCMKEFVDAHGPVWRT